MFHILLISKIPRSALVALVVGAAQVLVLVVLRLPQLQLRRNLLGAAEVARLLLLLDLRFLPAAERAPSNWARQGNSLLPANVTLFNSSFNYCRVSPLGVEVATGGCSNDRGRPDHHLRFCNLGQILSRLF